MLHKDKKYKKLIWLSGAIIIGIMLLLIAKFTMLQEADMPIENVFGTEEEIAAYDTSDWTSFDHPDFSYTFHIPRDAFMARTFSPEEGDVSALIEGKRKQTFAISKGEEYYIYLYPEGGYDRDDVALKGEEPVETREVLIDGKKAVREVYDEENVYIRFTDHHDFRMQLFVKDGVKEHWLLVEKIVSLMEISDEEMGEEVSNS